MNSSTSASDPTGSGVGRFTLRAVVFGMLAMVVVALASFSGIPATRVDYMAGMNAKHERLKSLPSPKVIIIGGSNATFGMDSETIERALCRPVVNMAIHGGLNFDFMVNEIKDELGPGDLVLISLELSLYTDRSTLNVVHDQAIDRYPPSIKFISAWHWPKAILEIAIMRYQATWRNWTGRTWPVEENVYRADGFTERGDLISHLGMPLDSTKLPFMEAGFEGEVSKDYVRAARDLEAHALEAGARVIYCWPAVAKGAYPGKEAPLIIRSELTELGQRIIGKAEDYIFPDSSFLDTPYHLRAPGKKLRTGLLLRDLCEEAPEQCCAGMEG